MLHHYLCQHHHWHPHPHPYYPYDHHHHHHCGFVYLTEAWIWQRRGNGRGREQRRWEWSGRKGVETEKEAVKRECGERGWRSTSSLHDEDPSWCLKPDAVLRYRLHHFLIKVSHLLFFYLTIEMTAAFRSVHDTKYRKSPVQRLEVNTCCYGFTDPSGVWLFSSEWGDAWSSFLWDFWQFLLVYNVLCSYSILSLSPSIPSPHLSVSFFCQTSVFVTQSWAGCLSFCVHGSSRHVVPRRHFTVPHPLARTVFLHLVL